MSLSLSLGERGVAGSRQVLGMCGSGDAGQTVRIPMHQTDLPEKVGGATMFRDLGGNNGRPLKV